MKRIITFLFTLFSILLGISGCSIVQENGEIVDIEYIVEEEPVEQLTVYEEIKNVVTKLNENSNLYIELLTFASEIEYASHFDVERIRNTPTDEQMEGGFDIITIQGMGSVRPFPWSSGNLRLLQLSWTVKEEYHVFGIKMGDNLEIAEETLYGLGFVKNNSFIQSDCHVKQYGLMTVFEKNFVNIALFVEERNSEIILISLLVGDPLMPIMEGPE